MLLSRRATFGESVVARAHNLNTVIPLRLRAHMSRVKRGELV
jgi:hypothetical protein